MNDAGFLHVGISATYRDRVHQDWLFAQGRTRPGNIVTNARGGSSIHNYRLAFDFFRNIRGQEFADRTPAERAFWDTAGRIWVEMGGVWGGNWRNFVDRPHCEFTGGLQLSDLQAGRRLPDDTQMLWELQSMESEVVEVRFNTISEIAERHNWAVPTISKLTGNGVLRGNSGDGTGLDLSLDMIRILVFNDRAGLYDKAS